MASVFLSYDHDDADHAAPIVDALEKAGHSVWWDRHIAGGTEYNNEIERAVERSDAVVVLWSKGSVKSAWVRDEAAEGRDQGKLVPVLIDAVKPPMGFRQYQTIGLSRSRGRARDPAMAELLRAIDGLGASAATVRNKPTPPSRRRFTPKRMAGLALVALAVLAAALWQKWSSTSSTLSVTVVPGDAGAAAFARSLMVQLGSLQGTSADALDLVEPESRARPDLTLKVGGVGGTAGLRAGLSLVDNRAGTLLWSREFVQPGGNPADLGQQVAYSTGQVLRCAAEALAPTHRKLELPTLKLYLNGCADLSNLLAKDPRIAIPTFRKVIDQAPTFAGGWAKLVLAEMVAYRQTDATDLALRRDLRAHIDQARKLHPRLAEPALAESWLQPPRPISGWMGFADEAVAKDPNHPEALMNRATGLMHAGRMREAVADVRRAVQSEPLYPAARDALVGALAHSGATAEARNELGEVERLWPGASSLPNVRFLVEYRYGDPGQALRILQSGKLGFSPTRAQISFLQARIEPNRSTIEAALTDARNSFRGGSTGFSEYVQTLAYFGRNEEAAQVLLAVDPATAPGVILAFFRPYFHDLRHDPRFMAIADRFELIQYWRETGRWADYCSEPDLPYLCRKEAAKFGR